VRIRTDRYGLQIGASSRELAKGLRAASTRLQREQLRIRSARK
jgi:hypothetical protein